MTFIDKILSKAKKAYVTSVNAIEELRIERIRLQDERDQVEAMPLPRAEADAAMQDGLRMIADDATDALSVSSLMQPDKAPYLDLQVAPRNYLNLLVAANQDAFRSMISIRLDELYGERDGITADEKKRRLEKFDNQILEIELAEEAAIRNAESEGFKVLRRGDAAPQAVLASDEALPL